MENRFKGAYKPLSLQKRKLEIIYKNSYCKINGDTLIWKCSLQPTVYSYVYKVEIKYKIGSNPQILVKNEIIENSKGKIIPHTYKSPSKKYISLCLFCNNEFTDNSWIADTLIPWTVDWLFYFETWLVTGEWNGGGKHPRK